MVRVCMCIGHEFSLNCLSWVVKIVLFQSIELEELDDQARLVLPPHSSIKAVVRKKYLDKNQIHLIGVLAMYYRFNNS